MRLSAAITGDLPKFMQAQVEAAKIAVTQGVQQVSYAIQNDLKDQVRAAGLGKLYHTWQVTFYPPKSRLSLKKAGFIYPDSPKAIKAFNEGETIRSKHGAFLAVPSPDAPKTGEKGKRISPSNFPEQRYGRLRFVYRPHGVSLLVVDNVKAAKKGGFRKAPATALRSGRGLTTVVMFFLVPQVHLRKRLDIHAAAERNAADLPQAILDAWPEKNDGK